LVANKAKMFTVSYMKLALKFHYIHSCITLFLPTPTMQGWHHHTPGSRSWECSISQLLEGIGLQMNWSGSTGEH